MLKPATHGKYQPETPFFLDFLKWLAPKASTIWNSGPHTWMCLQTEIFQISIVLRICACCLAIFQMWLADNLQDAVEPGGLRHTIWFLSKTGCLEKTYAPIIWNEPRQPNLFIWKRCTFIHIFYMFNHQRLNHI